MSGSYHHNRPLDAVPLELELEDGTVFPGCGFGSVRESEGEVVFNTAMMGYVETLTDPSYRGQILCATYPLIGNYGVPTESWESPRIQVQGLLIHHLTQHFSHHRAYQSLDQWLKNEGIPGIYGIDTRALTRHIRHRGTLPGRIRFHPTQPRPVHTPDALPPVFMPEVARTVTAPHVDRIGQGSRTILLICTGAKNNIIRELNQRDTGVIRVPFYEAWAEYLDQVDGVVVGNGPGDPRDLEDFSIKLREVMLRRIPLFGICLGHQLIAQAAGARIEKLAFGHRSVNQPVKDVLTGRCFITSQNHGYAVLANTLPPDWIEWMVNLNDGSNEGLRHRLLPIMSVQFHPEAAPGPVDTGFLFDEFMSLLESKLPPKLETIAVVLPSPRPQRVLVLGSGALKIGQAGEFDYSGSQALKALREEGIYTVLLNPNIATVQTSEALADAIYLLPVDPVIVEEILVQEAVDGILLGFGGQIALNCGLELEAKGVLKRLGVTVLGTSVDAIRTTEDRAEFAKTLESIGVLTARGRTVTTVGLAVDVARELGFPVMLRAGFALGGSGSGIARTPEQCEALAARALTISTQVLVEECLYGWKEIEYELVRDCAGNCIAVCNMENVDPMGIHTGESIVVAPSQTLNDYEYHRLRSVALRTISHLGIVGECNIQFALNPGSSDYRVIEVNARLSRSSALASKATGYPLAYVAAKLALGLRLDEIVNAVTGTTPAFFEPALDYIVCKIPRWDLEKFPNVDHRIGTEMKSVGEVMAIGRSFSEVLNKALRMLDIGAEGFSSNFACFDNIESELKEPTPRRIFAIANALYEGSSVDTIAQLTHIDRYFLHEMERIIEMQKILQKHGKVGRSIPFQLDSSLLYQAKTLGFSDAAIARSLGQETWHITEMRRALGIVPHIIQIDTTAGEYPARTNYLYLTYAAVESNITAPIKPSVLLLGSGTYRIGSSVEFDWCCVEAALTARELGYETILLNCNPETVSTDYDICNRLIFDEISVETVLEIVRHQNPIGVVVSVGGQLPNTLSLPLHRLGVRILGTSPEAIDCAENRRNFSTLLDELDISQPKWGEVGDTIEHVKTLAQDIGFPLLVRPSYVLSGSAMKVAWSQEELERYLDRATKVSPDHPVVLSKFEENAREIEFDAVASVGDLMNYAICEHIEWAGVHSGDATLICPSQTLHAPTLERIVGIGRRLARALKITGPFNIQLLVRRGQAAVIECNLRASRSFPFVSKVLGINLAREAMQAILASATGQPLVAPIERHPRDGIVPTSARVGVKVAQFSFQRMRGADPVVGVEMASTGEAACLGMDPDEALLKALWSVGLRLPVRGILVFGYYGEIQRHLEELQDLGVHIHELPGWPRFFQAFHAETPPAPDWRTIDLVLSMTAGTGSDDDTAFEMRRSAQDRGIPVFTDLWLARRILIALRRLEARETILTVEAWPTRAPVSAPSSPRLLVGMNSSPY